MAMRGSRSVLLLTLVLLAASLALTSRQTCDQKNIKFQREHVNYPRVRLLPDPYCNWIMRWRNMYGKQLNTFIHAPNPTINNVCLSGGIPIKNGLRRSRSVFSTTTCRFNPLTRSYNGRYVSRIIVIRCCRRLPVYYKE